MNTHSKNQCHNLIIQWHPIDTLSNIAYVIAFFKEFYEADNPDFAMSDESKMGFYILLAMVQQAAQFEVKRLSGELDIDAPPFAHEPMPKEARDQLEKIFNRILNNTDNSTE